MDSIPTDQQRLVDFLTDGETNLLGRDYFRMRLEEEFKKSWRYDWQQCLLLVDVEGLNRIEEDEGERSYRSTLLGIAGELLTASRDTDLSTRLNHSRFAILLTGTGDMGAQVFVQRVLMRILEGGFGRIAMHIGGSVSPQEQLTDCDEFMARAETALAKAHERGPNQFVLWSEPSV